MHLFRARLAEKFVRFGIARTIHMHWKTGYMPFSPTRHSAGSGQLAQNSSICRFVELALAHIEIPIARYLDQLHPSLLCNLNAPMITIAWFLHSLTHNSLYSILPWPKPKVPAMIEASSKILKRCIVTYSIKRGDTSTYLSSSMQISEVICK